MKATIIYTANPQEFFDGIEPEELTIKSNIYITAESEIAKKLAGGYTAIIRKADHNEYDK